MTVAVRTREEGRKERLRDKPWSRYKASIYYHAYGYGYRLLLVLFLLYVIQSYNDYCYYYASVRSPRTIFISVIIFYAFKYYKHLCSGVMYVSVQLYINERDHELCMKQLKILQSRSSFVIFVISAFSALYVNSEFKSSE